MKTWPGWTRAGDTLRHTSGATVVVRDRHPDTDAPTRVQWFACGDWGTCSKICDAVERAQAALERDA